MCVCVCGVYPRKFTINPLYQLLQLIHLVLNPQLSKYIIVLNAVQELGQTPEAVRLDDVALLLRQRRHVVVLQILPDLRGHRLLEKDQEKRCHEVVHTLRNPMTHAIKIATPYNSALFNCAPLKIAIRVTSTLILFPKISRFRWFRLVKLHPFKFL